MLRLVFIASVVGASLSSAADPLTPTATLGFAKIWGHGRFSVSPDGKTVIIRNQWYDWTKGVPIDPPCPLPEKADWHSILADGRIAVCKDQQLTLHDGKTGKELKKLGIFRDSAAFPFAAAGQTYLTTGVRGGAAIATAAAPEPVALPATDAARQLTLSPDGAWLTWLDRFGQSAHLYDVANKKVIQLPVKPPVYAVAANGKFACMDAGAAWHLFDPATGEELHVVEKPKDFRGRPTVQLLPAADQFVALVAGKGWALVPTDEEEEPTVVPEASFGGDRPEFIDPRDWHDERPARTQRLVTPDGKRLFVKTENGVIREYDVFTGKRTDSYSDELPPMARVLAVDDKRAVCWAEDGRYAIWEIATGTVIRTGALPDQSPDGKPVKYVGDAGVGKESFAARGAASVYQPTNLQAHVRLSDGKPVDPDAKDGWVTGAVGFLPDGRAVVGRDSGVKGDPRTELRDALTGARVGALPLPSSKLPLVSFHPNLRTAVAVVDADANVYELASGTMRKSLPTAFRTNGVWGARFSADGARVVAANYDHVSAFETATYDLVARCPRVGTLSVPADTGGRWLVAFGADQSWDQFAIAPRFTIHDLNQFPLDEKGTVLPLTGFSAMKAFVITPDARRAIIVPHLGLPSVWDLSAVTGAKATPAGRPKRPADPWAALASPDAKVAGDVMAALVRTPPFAVAHLGERFKPVPVADPKAVTGWLVGLESKDFAAREAAGKELAANADQAEKPLRDALRTNTNPEAHRRLEKLVAALDSADEQPATLQAIRALEVLEAIGGKEAKALVARVAAGAPAARATAHAKQSLARMK